MKSAAEIVFGSLTSTPQTSYDHTKLNLGKWIRQYAGSGEDAFAGPMKIGIARPFEQIGVTVMIPHVIKWSETVDWVFLATNASAATTRAIYAYEYDKATSTFTYKGYVTLTYPTTGNETIRGFRMTYDKHTVGTVGVSGTAVTGTGTSFSTGKVSVGSRIGFGSTDPTQITTWYNISAVGSDTGITLAENAGTIASGTAYVIEELRAATATTNATAANGGLYLAKGLHMGLFINTGTVIPAATTVDGIRAVYWLKDAATVTNTVSLGLALDDYVDATTQYAYVNDTLTPTKIYKYNLRATLAGLSGGGSVSAFVLVTGTVAVTGTNQQGNNGRVGTLNHGPGNGVKSFFFTTTTRVYRAAISGITSGSTTWQSDVMLEVPPGGANVSFATTAALHNTEIADTIDRLIVVTYSANLGLPLYVTKYNTVSDQFDHIFLTEDRHINQSTANAGLPNYPRAITGANINTWSQDGILYILAQGGSALVSFLWAVPLSADWTYAAATQNQLITPAIATPGATKFYRAFVNESQLVGSNEFGVSPEPFKMYYRTSGITDNSGGWTLLDDTRDLSGVSPATSIQFMFEFKQLGPTMIGSRLHSLSVIYDQDDSLPAELRWSLADSNNSNGTVGMTQTAAFGSLSTLTITYRRADTDAVVLVQASSGTTNGTFEYWTGSAWAAGLGSNAIGTRRRFVPSAGLPAGVNTYAKVVAA